MAEEETVVVVNVTAPDGELWGRLELTRSDLKHPQWVGEEVFAQMPLSALQPKEGGEAE